MNFASTANDLQKLIRSNAPTILTSLGVSGTIGTAFLAGRASWKAAHRFSEGPPIEQLTKMEIFEEVWDLYLPVVVAGAFSVGCIIGANKVSSARAAAAYSVAAITEKAFTEYKDKVIETHGVKKEQAIRDSVAQDHVNANPPPSTIHVGTGPVIFQESLTGRYFNSDMETIRKAVNDVNARLNSEMYVTLNDFYYLIGLGSTSDSSRVGWEAGKLLDLSYSTVMTEDKKAAITFEYNYTKAL